MWNTWCVHLYLIHNEHHNTLSASKDTGGQDMLAHNFNYHSQLV